MEQLSEQVVNIIRNWSSDITKESLVERVYLFGSVLRPDRFVGGRSDVDLLLVLSDSVRTPLERAGFSCKLLEPKKRLESELEKLLGRRADGKPIVSLLLLTRFECDNAIHKGRDHRFFLTTRFLDLCQSNEEEPQFGSTAADLFHLLYPGLVQTIQRAQDYRSRFLSVDARGIRLPNVADTWDDAQEALPKEICRAAAPLRFFEESLSNGSEHDQVAGLEYITELIAKAAHRTNEYQQLRDWLTIRGGARAPRTSLSPERQLVLWEILAHEAQVLVARGEAKRRADVPARGLGPESERAFLEAVARPSLRIGGRSIECKLLPPSLWTEERRGHLYLDDPEAERRIELRMSGLSLPGNTLDALIQEIEESLKLQSSDSSPDADDRETLSEVHGRLTREGSNAYPRVVALPRLETASGVPSRPDLLVVILGPSRYGVALVEERRLKLPTAVRLRSHHVLNSLGVRVAYVYQAGGAYWVECHQRKGGPNATYKDSWDVGGAGYIDPERHKDPLDDTRISPWQAAAAEIAEELAIAPHQLPHRDHYFFFGLGRNDPTGQIDVLGYCLATNSPDPDRPPTARVNAYDRCELNPASVARFLSRKRRWVPTAVLTLVLTLEALDYSRDEIDETLGALIGDVVLNP
jgi:predicted nucleotidyltransferase